MDQDMPDFGMPNNLEEAVDTLLEFLADKQNFDIIRMGEDEFVLGLHNRLGQFIRNAWLLWWHPQHGYDVWPEKQPPLNKFFEEKGITHADDISSIIFTTAWRRVHKKDILLENQIQECQTHWRQSGFPDGIYKSR